MDVARDRVGIEGRRVDVEPLARLQKLADHETEGQRHRRDRLEIEQGLDADPADLLEIAHRADPVHDGAEDDRPDHHLDERDEAVTKRLERGAGGRKIMADQDAGGDGEQNLDVSMVYQGREVRRSSKASPSLTP